jgi:small multidrug resistance pump
MDKYAAIALFIGSVFISAVSQILLKYAANRSYASKIREYMNAPVIGAYGMFFLSSLLTLFAYRTVPLTLGPILESTGYLFVVVLSLIFLREKMTVRKIAGNCLIIAGVIVAALL